MYSTIDCFLSFFLTLLQQREQLCKGLENVEQTDLVAVKQTMQAIQAVASKPDQLNSEARVGG